MNSLRNNNSIYGQTTALGNTELTYTKGSPAPQRPEFTRKERKPSHNSVNCTNC